MILDIIFLICLVSAFVHGYRRGIIQSIFNLVAFVFGIMLALKFSHLLSAYLHEWFSINGKLLPFIAFVLVFLMVIILVTTLSKIIERIAEALLLGFLNRIIGGLLWCAILTLIFSTLLWFLNQIGAITPELKESSRAYPGLISLAPIVVDFFGNLVPYFQGVFDAIDGLIKEMSNEKSLQAQLS